MNKVAITSLDNMETYYVVYDDMQEEIIYITTSLDYCRLYIEDWLERNDEIFLDPTTGEILNDGESKIEDCMAGKSWGVSMRTYTGIIKRE